MLLWTYFLLIKKKAFWNTWMCLIFLNDRKSFSTIQLKFDKIYCELIRYCFFNHEKYILSNLVAWNAFFSGKVQFDQLSETIEKHFFQCLKFSFDTHGGKRFMKISKWMIKMRCFKENLFILTEMAVWNSWNERTSIVYYSIKMNYVNHINLVKPYIFDHNSYHDIF